jgi:maleate isomerase
LRIGVVTPHADVGPESELRAMAGHAIGIHSSRVPFGAMAPGGGMDPTIPLAPVRAFAESPSLDEAVELLAAAPIDVIGYGFTSSAYVLGLDGEREMIERLARRARGIPVVAPCAAAVAGLRRLGAARLALFDPPWFDSELSALGRKYYEDAGFEVLLASPCGLPSDQAKITPEALHDWVCERSPAEADAIVIAGNGFRAVGAIEAIEADTGRPVITANQALFWGALEAGGARTGSIAGYGRLFMAEG